MLLGASLPQSELGDDPAAVREWALAVEDMGFDYIAVIDHVLGARPGHPVLQGSRRFHFTSERIVHEPLVLLGYLAAMTRRVRLVTAIVILPQRQTALVAKQAAEVDLLSGGRLTLGVGLGWNSIEFEALGEDFRTRGQRIEEQIAVLRRLWTAQHVSYRGRWHTIDDAGLNPRPVQQPIPIWIGAESDTAIERAARIADGWIALGRPDEETARRVRLFRDATIQAGRDPSLLALVGSVGSRTMRAADDLRRDADAWQRFGGSHLTLNSTGAGASTLHAHLEALQGTRDAVAPILT